MAGTELTLDDRKKKILKVLAESKGWTSPERIKGVSEGIAPNRDVDAGEYEETLEEMEKEGLVKEDPNTSRIPERSGYDATELGELILQVETGELEGENHIDLAGKLNGLKEYYGEELESKVSMSEPTYDKKMRLWELPDRVKELIRKGTLSQQSALRLEGVSEDVANRVCDRIEEGGLKPPQYVISELIDEVRGPELWSCPFCGGEYKGKRGLSIHSAGCDEAPEGFDPIDAEWNEEERTFALPEQKEEKGPKRRNWSEEEKKFLRENYPEKPVEEISEALHRTVDAVRRKASDLGVKSEGYWREGEIDFLRGNYEGMTDGELGSELGRSRASVQKKRHDLNLIKPQHSRKFSDEELVELHERGMTDRGIASELGVSRSIVGERRRKLDLKPNDKVDIQLEGRGAEAFVKLKKGIEEKTGEPRSNVEVIKFLMGEVIQGEARKGEPTYGEEEKSIAKFWGDYEKSLLSMFGPEPLYEELADRRGTDLELKILDWLVEKGYLSEATSCIDEETKLEIFGRMDNELKAKLARKTIEHIPHVIQELDREEKLGVFENLLFSFDFGEKIFEHLNQHFSRLKRGRN